MTFSTKIWMALATAGFVAAGIGTEQAQASSYGAIAAPGVYYGSGNENTNGNWWSNTNNGVEVALRAHNRFDTSWAIDGSSGSYAAKGGAYGGAPAGDWHNGMALWNYDFSVYSANTNTFLSNLVVKLRVDTDPTAGTNFVAISNAYTNWGDNSYITNTGSVHTDGTPMVGDRGLQQSVNPYFLNSGFQPNFNPSAPGLYEIELTAYKGSNGIAFGTGIATTSIQVQVVPEPETYAMMLAGLGLMGFIARRRKQNGAAA